MNVVTIATRSGVRQLKERNCWAFTLHTNELSEEQFKRLTTMDETCKVMLSDENITKDQVEEIEAVPIKKESKMTRSQEIRFQLKLIYELDPESFETFEEYYNSKMSVWVGKLKDMVRKLKQMSE